MVLYVYKKEDVWEFFSIFSFYIIKLLVFNYIDFIFMIIYNFYIIMKYNFIYQC